MFSIMKYRVCGGASSSSDWQPSSLGRPLKYLVAKAGDGYQVASVVVQWTRARQRLSVHHPSDW